MPRLIEPGAGEAISLEECVALLADAHVDPRDEDAFAALGPVLARLARNRSFLGDAAMREVEGRFAGQRAGGYNAQVLLLRAPHAGFALRANLWPSHADAALRAGGAGSFFYDLPHDHNFSFLTVGYLGPGYWSDYYLFDGREDAVPGDPAGLVFDRRARLEEGRVMLYRAHRDVHVQYPPDAFSVSLNVLAHDPAQAWRTQYRFDTAADTVAEALTMLPSEALVTLAVHLGGEEGVALAGELALRHHAPRMRRTALAALAAAGGQEPLYERVAGDPDGTVRAMACARLTAP